MPKVGVFPFDLGVFAYLDVHLFSTFGIGVFAYLDVCFSFDVRCSMFDVGRSSFFVVRYRSLRLSGCLLFIRCWMFDVRCWTFIFFRCSMSESSLTWTFIFSTTVFPFETFQPCSSGPELGSDPFALNPSIIKLKTSSKLSNRE